MGGSLALESYTASATSPEKAQADQLLQLVHDEIHAHKQDDKSRSYLDKGFDFIYRSDEKSLKRLSTLEEQMQNQMKNEQYGAIDKMREEVLHAIKDDQKSLNRQNNISLYGGTALKVGALFVGGKFGWGATGAFYALDQARPEDSAWKQIVDGSLGATKGLAYKGLLNGVLDSKLPIPAKALTMSLGGRGLDTLLTSDNYYDKKAGGYSLLTGLKATGSELTNVQHLAVDGAVMTVSFGLGYGLNRALGGSLAESPFFSRVATSGLSGVSRGAIGEIAAIRAAGEEFSWTRVGNKALLMGTVYALASVPGAIQADQAAHHDAQQQHNNPTDAQHNGDDVQFQQYRKMGTVRAEQLKEPTTWTTGKGETMHAEAGDWKITGADGSVWSVKPDIFAQTYSPVAGTTGGEFAKTAITRAAKLSAPITIQTLEGQGSGVAGDYLVVGPKGEQYIVGGAKFESMYKPTESN